MGCGLSKVTPIDEVHNRTSSALIPHETFSLDKWESAINDQISRHSRHDSFDKWDLEGVRPETPMVVVKDTARPLCRPRAHSSILFINDLDKLVIDRNSSMENSSSSLYSVGDQKSKLLKVCSDGYYDCDIEDSVTLPKKSFSEGCLAQKILEYPWNTIALTPRVIEKT